MNYLCAGCAQRSNIIASQRLFPCEVIGIAAFRRSSFIWRRLLTAPAQFALSIKRVWQKDRETPSAPIVVGGGQWVGTQRR